MSQHQNRADTAEDRGAPEIALDETGDVTLPLQRVVTGRAFCTGKSNAGKSNTAMVIAEEVLEYGVPMAIVDPEGEFTSLREEYAVIHAGVGGSQDIGVDDPEDAYELARRAVRESLPVVLDLSATGGEDGQRIAGAFVDGLFQAEGRHEKPFLLAIDECHEYIPTRAKTPSSEAVVRVAKRGRKRGLGLLPLSQRPADVKSEVITQADWLIWHRLTWQNDTNTVKKHVEGGNASVIPHLQTGEVVITTDWWTDAKRTQVRRQRVTDLGETPDIHQSIGSAPRNLPPDLAASGKSESPTADQAGVDNELTHADELRAPDELGRYQVLESVREDAARRYTHFHPVVLSPLNISGGDCVGVAVRGESVFLTDADADGVVLKYTAQSTPDGPMIKAGRNLCDLLDAQPEDHLRARDRGDIVELELIRDFEPQSTVPVLFDNRAKQRKDESSGADSLYLDAALCRYIEAEPGGCLSVEKDGEEYIIREGECDAGVSYQVRGADKPYSQLGSRGCSFIGAEPGDWVRGHPHGDQTARLVVHSEDAGHRQ